MIDYLLSSLRQHANEAFLEIQPASERGNRVKKSGKASFMRLLAALGATTLSACGFGDVDLQWSEEVQLADGQVIVIQRTAKGEMQGEGFQLTGWAPTEMALVFGGLRAGLVQPQEWRTRYTPIVLDYQTPTKTWSVVSTFTYCDEWRDLGRPALPYVEYQSLAGAPWVVVPLEQRLIGRERNLLTGPSSRGEPALVTLSSKQFRGGNSADVYRKIGPKWKHNSCGKPAR